MYAGAAPMRSTSRWRSIALPFEDSSRTPDEDTSAQSLTVDGTAAPKDDELASMCEAPAVLCSHTRCGASAGARPVG